MKILRQFKLFHPLILRQTTFHAPFHTFGELKNVKAVKLIDQKCIFVESFNE